MIYLKIDEEFKNLIPALSDEEFEQLEQNILSEGCRDAIVTWQGTIIDGHNRYNVCTKHNIEFNVVEKDFASKQDVVNWIVLNQFGRRNISNYNRALLALRLKNNFSEKAKEKQLSTLKQNIVTVNQKSDERDEFNTYKELAKTAGISHDTIHKVETITNKANDEIKVKLENGDMSINEAYKEIKTAEKAEKLEEKKQEILNQTKNSVANNKPKVWHMDCTKWLDLQPQCDLLLTDPPYSTDVDNMENFVDQWLFKALNKVKSTGFAFVFIGAYPNEVKAYLNAKIPEHIKLEQILIWEYKNTLGNNPKDKYKLNYQNILFFRGVNALDLDCPITNEQWAVQSVNAPDGRLGDRYHSWQKPIELAERLVRHTTKSGDIVLDPFVCTGTFVLAANKLGRQGFGCDNNLQNLEIAVSRGCDLHG